MRRIKIIFHVILEGIKILFPDSNNMRAGSMEMRKFRMKKAGKRKRRNVIYREGIGRSHRQIRCVSIHAVYITEAKRKTGESGRRGARYIFKFVFCVRPAVPVIRKPYGYGFL